MKNNLTSHQISADGNYEWEAPVYSPETASEESLLKIVVDSQLFRKFVGFRKDGTAVNFSRGPIGDHESSGWYPFYCTLEADFDFSSFFKNRSIFGRARVVARSEGRVIVEWGGN